MIAEHKSFTKWFLRVLWFFIKKSSLQHKLVKEIFVKWRWRAFNVFKIYMAWSVTRNWKLVYHSCSPSCVYLKKLVRMSNLKLQRQHSLQLQIQPWKKCQALRSKSCQHIYIRILLLTFYQSPKLKANTGTLKIIRCAPNVSYQNGRRV